jgi:hypothetical protein
VPVQVPVSALVLVLREVQPRLLPGLLRGVIVARPTLPTR